MGWGMSTNKYWHKSSKSFHIPSQCTIYHPCSHLFLQFQTPSNACFRDIVSIFSNPFQLHSGVRMHALETLFSNLYLHFQIISNTVTVYTLKKLFSFVLCMSQSFQITSECMLSRHCLHKMSAFQKHFKRMHALETLVSFFLGSSKLFQIPSGCML